MVIISIRSASIITLALKPKYDNNNNNNNNKLINI